MFFVGLQPNINYFSNPCASIFTGMTGAVSNPFMGGSIFNFSTPFFNFSNFGNPFLMLNNFSNPFMNLSGFMPFMPQIGMPFSIPSVSYSSTVATKPDGVDTDYSSSSSSKIKPGLLKGNLKGKEAYITSLCKKYDVDVGVVLSIIGQESGFGTSNLAKHNNFMGYRAAGDAGKSANGYGYFSTPEKGLEAAIKNLASYPSKYKKQGVNHIDFNNIDAIGRIYCEGSSYANALRKIYRTTVKKYLV